MPAKDKYHAQFKAALIKDGWVVTDDPLHLRWGGQDMYVDLGAEEVIAAEKGGRRIAVEIKSFVGVSGITDLQLAVGQFNLYRDVMEKTDPDRTLYLAVTEETFLDVFEEPVGKLEIEKQKLLLIVFDPEAEEIKQWIT
jgi:XisH protein